MSINCHAIKKQLVSVLIDESLGIRSVAESTQKLILARHIFSLYRGLQPPKKEQRNPTVTYLNVKH